MSEQVLVSVRFHGYYLELLVLKTSTIDQLVQAMRENSFIPANIQNSRLIFKKSSGEEVQGQMEVTSIMEKGDNSKYHLIVELKPQRNISQESGPQSSQSQINKLLEKIIRYLKLGTIDNLLKAKENQKLQATMAGHLSTIGQIFLQQKYLIEFYTAGLKALAQNHQAAIDELFTQFSDKVKNEQEQFKVVKDVNEHIKSLYAKITSQEEAERQMKRSLDQKNNELEEVRKQLNRVKAKVLQIQSEVEEKKSIISILNYEMQNLNKQLIKNQLSLEKMKSQHEISKKFGDQLTAQIKQHKDLLFGRQKQLMKSNNKIKLLEQLLNKKDDMISNKQQEMKEKNQEIQRIKDNSIDDQIVKHMTELHRTSMGMKKLTKARIENILQQKQLVDQLKLTIENEMKKPIVQILQLLSYDIGQHQNYCLKQTFQTLIHKKCSLLLIALPLGQNGKAFGAFTQQKYDKSPSSYFIPDFNGCSFLFSFIKKQLKHFKICDGENSMMFDLDNLVFGNDDLIVDFEKAMCSSKFVQGRSIAYNIENSRKNKESDQDYRFFLSDSQSGQRGSQVVNLRKYKIYEIRFDESKK